MEIPEIEAGYYQCMISSFRMSRIWIELFITIGSIMTTALGSFATLSYVSDDTKFKLGITLSIIGVVTSSFQILKNHLHHFIVEEQQSMKEAVRDAHQYSQINDH